MPVDIGIKSDGVLEQVAANMAAAPKWMPKIRQREVKRLGKVGIQKMMGMVGRNYYTGTLMRSIKAEYEEGAGMSKATINPTAKRGRWDGGLILEFGTRPIARCPYAPIAAWASAKGAPMPGAWLKIRRDGVSPHPFLDDTLHAVEPDLDKAVDNIIGAMVAAALHGATA